MKKSTEVPSTAERIQNREKPALLFHGTITPNLQEFEPRKRYTPQGADVPPRIYATGNPAFAAAHSFPWSSDEGVELYVKNGKVLLLVPERLKARLNQEVTIYSFDSNNFNFTKEETFGETYHTEEKAKSQGMQSFNSVTEAVEYFGGVVEIISDKQ